MRLFVFFAILPMLTILGIAWLWFFRPLGWFGQKVGPFFGSSVGSGAVIPYDFLQWDEEQRIIREAQAAADRHHRIELREKIRNNPWPKMDPDLYR